MRDFESFIFENIVRKQSPDRSRTEFLKKEAEHSYSLLQEMLAKIGIRNDNANDYVKICYDILMQLVRAKMLLAGFYASGQGAHEAEVSYMRKLGFKETEVQFADQLRFFRNGMLYYGTILDKQYAEIVIEFIKRNYLKLSK